MLSASAVSAVFFFFFSIIVTQAEPLGRRANSSSNSTSGFISSTWYTGWHVADVSLSSISWEKYTHASYAFALVQGSDPSNLTLADTDKTLIPQFVSTAHQNNVQAGLTVGGWTGSQSFSTFVQSADSTQFIKAIEGVVSQYELDTIEIDWEFPVTGGLTCNQYDASSDVGNLANFLTQLRNQSIVTKAGKPLTISATVSIKVWSGATPANIATVAAAVDFITIMNYDIWGLWFPTVGPNAPLADSCAPTPEGSATSALKSWSDSGMPANKIVLGVPSYGRAYSVDSSKALSGSSIAAYPTWQNSTAPLGDKWSDGAGPDACGVMQVAGNTQNFRWMVQNNTLTDTGAAAASLVYDVDSCSQTAYAYDKTKEIMYSYDDATSFKAKGEWIKTNNLLGFAMWEAGGDHNDILLDSIRSGAGVGS